MSFDTANDAIRYGIAKVHQEINMVPEMTVAQNIALGNEPKKFGIIDFKKLNKDVEKVLQRLHLSLIHIFGVIMSIFLKKLFDISAYGAGFTIVKLLFPFAIFMAYSQVSIGTENSVIHTSDFSKQALF